MKVKGGSYGRQIGGDNTTFSYRDAFDLTEPRLLDDKVFIATNIMETIQQLGECAGKARDGSCACELASVELCCPAGRESENGVLTGRCGDANGTKPLNLSFCEVSSWCPLEPSLDKSLLGQSILRGVENMTIFLHLTAEFPRYGVVVSNYDKKEGVVAGLNLFTVGSLLRLANATVESVFPEGGILLLRVEYDCDLNHALSECVPDISAKLLRTSEGDLTGQPPKDRTARHLEPGQGYNIRTSNFFYRAGRAARMLRKSNGLLVRVLVFGRAGKFDLLRVTIRLGAAVGLLAVAKSVCDFMLEYVMPLRRWYSRFKYLPVGEGAGGEEGADGDDGNQGGGGSERSPLLSEGSKDR